MPPGPICGFLLSEWVAPGSLEDPDYGPHEYTSACVSPPGHEGRHSWANEEKKR